MKRKLIAALLALSSAFMTMGFASCVVEKLPINPDRFEEYARYEITLDTTEYNPVVSHRGALDYEGLALIYTTYLQGQVMYSTKMAVTPDMVVSSLDTSSVGEKEAVLKYETYTWTIPYTVKYQVDFLAEVDLLVAQTSLLKV